MIANLLDGPYATCLNMTVVGDKLSAHKPSAFDSVFGADQAKRYLARLEFAYTPKHGSWLEMAEIELSILQGDCLNRHMATKELLVSELNAWETSRNTKQAKANRQFTTKDARVKLHKLYPTT